MTTTKTTITISLTTISLLALTLFAVFSKAPNLPAVQAQEVSSAQGGDRDRDRPCSPRTLKGAHGYSYQGTVLGKAITAAGPITFDGRGSLRATYNSSLAGIPFSGRAIGTYIVNDDCTGTLRLQFPALGVSANGSFVIVNEGKETFFLSTDENIAVIGVTKKQ